LAKAEGGCAGGCDGWAGVGAGWAADLCLSGMGELRLICYDIVTKLIPSVAFEVDCHGFASQ
jgi:hypothetical protein